MPAPVTTSRPRDVFRRRWRRRPPRNWVPSRPAGILFDAASNSGYNTADALYSWSHMWQGGNRVLVVGVSLLTDAGVTVTGITYNGIALTKIGHVATAAIRAEQWYLKSDTTGAPGPGTYTIEVTLSGTADSVGSATSYNGVHQTSPIEAFNSATAVNGAAADATVDITTVADNDWVVDCLATDDTAVTVGAGQTSRVNVTGASGSGTMSHEGPKTPAGGVTMSWGAVGAGATWSIVGVALRPVEAAQVAVANLLLPNPRLRLGQRPGLILDATPARRNAARRRQVGPVVGSAGKAVPAYNIRVRLKHVERFAALERALRVRFKAPRKAWMRPAPPTLNPYGGISITATNVYGITLTANNVYGITITALLGATGTEEDVYDIGDSTRFQAAFTNAAGSAADPTTVTLRLRLPTGAIRILTYAGGDLTKSSTGVYYYDYTHVHDGDVDYKFEGTGSVIAAEEDTINVRESAFDESD